MASKSSHDFQQWWNSKELNGFREQLISSDTWPDACWGCRLAEQHEGQSFRTAVNKWSQTDYSHPAGWNIMFGNICNLGCWICSERSSSVIFQHKKRAGLVQGDDLTEQQFQALWPDLKQNIMKSYQHHDTVTLTILGGEPLYNRTVINFLTELMQLDLAPRTRLEFHTNATQYPNKIFAPSHTAVWQHVSIFLSLDAVGPYAEWLRYGCDWHKVNRVVDDLIAVADHTEIHCTLTVLNINQLAELKQYADSKQLRLNITPTDNPDFMTLENWDLGRDRLLVMQPDPQFQQFYDLIGTTPCEGTSDLLKQHIRRFDGVRRPLNTFDPVFAEHMGW